MRERDGLFLPKLKDNRTLSYLKPHHFHNERTGNMFPTKGKHRKQQCQVLFVLGLFVEAPPTILESLEGACQNFQYGGNSGDSLRMFVL